MPISKMKLFLVTGLIGFTLYSFSAFAAEKWRTGYYANQEPFFSNLPISEIPWNQYTHVIQSAIVPIRTGEVTNAAGVVVLDGVPGVDASFYKIIYKDEVTQITTDNAALFVNAKNRSNTKALVSLIVGKDQAITMDMNTKSTTNNNPACQNQTNVDCFVTAVAKFVTDHGYDGVDIDWENNVTLDLYTAQFPGLMCKLRAALPSKVITVAAQVTYKYVYIKQCDDGAFVYDKIDQINVMNYDQDTTLTGGKLSPISWFNSAVKLTPCSGNCNTAPFPAQPFKYDYSYLENNVKVYGTNNWTQDESMWNLYDAYIIKIPRGKLGLGVPFYGWIKQAAQLNSNVGIYAPRQAYVITTPATSNIPTTGEIRTQISYKQLITGEVDPLTGTIMSKLNNGTLVPYYWGDANNRDWDVDQKAPYIQYNINAPFDRSKSIANNNAFVSYTDPQQIQESIKLLNEKQLGGMMTFALNHEYIASETGDARYPLTTAMNADLSVAISGPTAVSLNSVMTYTVTVTNNGPSQAVGVMVNVNVNDSPCALTLPTLAILDSGTSATCSITVIANNAGTFYQTAKVQGDGYDLNSINNMATATTTVSKFSQSITVTTPPPLSASYGSSFNVGATASSGLLVSFTGAGGCAISGNTVTMTSGSTPCEINYDQAGDNSYAAAPRVTQTTGASPITQSITFGAQTTSTRVYSAGTIFAISPIATTTSGLVVAYSSATVDVCTVSGTTVTIVAVGTCTLAADQAGNTNYSAAMQKTQSVTISKASQTIASDQPATFTRNKNMTVTATAALGLSVTIAKSGGSCEKVSGGSGSAVYAMKDRNSTCTLKYTQNGGLNYNAATNNNMTIKTTAKQLIHIAELIV